MSGFLLVVFCAYKDILWDGEVYLLSALQRPRSFPPSCIRLDDWTLDVHVRVIKINEIVLYGAFRA